MNTNGTTSTAFAPTASAPVHVCSICGRRGLVTFSHRVQGRAYGYVWCAHCSHGRYVNLHY